VVGEREGAEDSGALPADLPQLLDARVVAKILSISLSGARRIMAMDLPRVIVGEKAVRVRADDLAAYIASRTTAATESENRRWEGSIDEGRTAPGTPTTRIRTASGGASARASPIGRPLPRSSRSVSVTTLRKLPRVLPRTRPAGPSKI